MNRHDPNLAKVELVAGSLGNLCDELVFVGGCAAGLLLTDPAATTARLTTPHFDNYLPGLLAQDETLAQRVTTASTRLQSIASLALP